MYSISVFILVNTGYHEHYVLFSYIDIAYTYFTQKKKNNKIRNNIRIDIIRFELI